jgi:hypothetical protein
MPSNNNNPTAPKPKKRTFKIAKKKKEKFFKVTLTFSFERHHGSTDDFEKGEHGYEDESNDEFCARLQDWRETDKLYGTNEKIMRHVKENDALSFVEYLTDGEVIAAKWLDGFKIQFIVKYDHPELMKTAEELKEYLEDNSLEDGEYESSGDNGWTVKTLKDSMGYGLTDYRRNPILIEEVSSGVLSGGGRRRKSKTRKH